MIETPRILEIFERRKVFQKGHYRGTSGSHMDLYVDKYALYPYYKDLTIVCLALAQRFLEPYTPEVVVGPAKGGIILSQWVAYHLTMLTNRDVCAIFAEPNESSSAKDQWIITHGYEQLVAGRKTAVVDDTVTTGGTVRSVVETVRRCNGLISAVGVMCAAPGKGNKITAEDVGGVKNFFALTTVERQVSIPEECPQCRQGMPVNTNLGKR
jgi:orotate phosphoribosyltransferase